MALPSEMLAKIRFAIDLSQHEMADELRVARRTYERYERGETKKVPAEVLMRAQALQARRKK